MKVSESGEFGLIKRLRELVGEPEAGEVWVGDDAAVVRGSDLVLFTTDLLIEGVHFDFQLTGPHDLGYKSMAVNFSDVAAMGGSPTRAVVGMGIKGGMEVEWLEHVYEGMRACCGEFGAAVVGGDISRSDCFVIAVSVMGKPSEEVVLRGGAGIGDLICVTGTLGMSAAGYRLLRAGLRGRDDLRNAHLRPRPRVREAAVIVKHGPTSMIDVSDGLVADLIHILDESMVGAVVREDSIPSVDLSGVDLDRTSLDLALYGGEDYELCFTVRPDSFDAMAAELNEATGTPLTAIGEIVEESRGRHLIKDGDQVKLEPKGWDHLKN